LAAQTGLSTGRILPAPTPFGCLRRPNPTGLAGPIVAPRIRHKRKRGP